MIELHRIDELLNVLKQLPPMSDENKEKLHKKFRLEFSYNSNHLEGNTLTYGETERLLLFDDTQGNHSLREYEEMKGSDIAYRLVNEWAQETERPLTESMIKNLNEIILVRPFWKDAITPDGQTTRRLIKVGDYKDHPNSVRLQNGEIFHYANPLDTPILMGELVEWYNKEVSKNELPHVIIAALLHYEFVRIHPFDDGNGRIARLIMNYSLIKHGLPPIVLKSHEKGEYLTALHRADTGDRSAFTTHIASQLIWSLELCIKAAKGQSIDEPGDFEKRLKQLQNRLQIGNEEVSIKRSINAIRDIYDKSICLLLLAISSRLKQVESFFGTRYDLIGTPTNIIFNLSDSNFNSRMEEYLSSGERHFFYYQVSLHDARGKDKSPSVEATLKFYFHQNNYQISSESTINLDKLYSNQLNEDDIDTISEKFALEILEQVERIFEK